jgi:two-component system, LytTR family, response regulator
MRATSPVRVIIADDEPLARDGLRAFVSEHRDAIVVAECADGRETIDAIRKHAPDVVFLDVQMPHIDGFGVVSAVGAEQMPSVVFVTAHDDYAIRAFEVSAVDYLLKPVDPARLREAYDRAVRSLDRSSVAKLEEVIRLLAQRADAQQSHPARAELDRLAVRVGHRIEFLEPHQIDWIEADGNYARVYALGKSYLVRQTLDALHEQLGTRDFVRLRRSVLARVRAIKAAEPLVKGKYVLILQDGTRLTSSRYFQQNVRQLFGP